MIFDNLLSSSRSDVKSNLKFDIFQSTQHDLVKIAPMAALTGADLGKSSLSSRSAYPEPKSRYDFD